MSAPELATYLSPELLEQLGDAVTVIDRNWRYVYCSSAAAVVIGRPVEEVIGQPVWEIFPEVVGTEQYHACVRAMEERTRQRLVWYFSTVDAWLQQDALPVADGLVILVNDITEQQLAAHRAEQLVKVGETLAGATSDDDVNRSLVNEVLPLVRASGGSLLIADEERGVMRAVGWHGTVRDLNQTWGEFPLASETPSVHAWRTGESVYLHDLDEAKARFPAVADAYEAVGGHTIAAIPLVSSGVRLGALVVNFDTSNPLGLGDRQFLATTAAMAAQALARVRLLSSEKRSIAELQRSLLPRQLPQVPGLLIAARYLASDTTTAIGGDWYDVIPLAGSSVGLVMGDVEGHDLGAAALMGLVRSAVRAYAIEGHPPSFVLDRANAFLAGLSRDRIVTVSYAQLHPLERLISTVSAGHPGTQVATPDGKLFQIPAEVGPPLGVFDSGMRWNETTSTLPAGSTFAVFTDGLVEVRREDISVGIQRVCATLLEYRSAPPDELADRLLQIRGKDNHDDVAILTGRLTAAAEESRRFSRRLPATPASVFLARRFVAQLLETWDIGGDHIETVTLVVSELATNAARDSEDAIVVGLSCTEELIRVEISDTSHRMPVPVTTMDEEATSGRGLVLVEAMASRWGVESEGLSKQVWAEFDL